MGQLGIGKGAPGGVLVVDRGRKTEQRVADGHLGHVLGHVSELQAASDVAAGKDVSSRGAAAFVDDDSAFVGADARRLKV